MARVALYSHDTFGLGHLRRSLKVASHIRSHLGSIEGLLLTGSPWHSLFPLPDGFRLEALPPVEKQGPRLYASRDNGRTLEDVLAERRRRATESLEAFAPDLMIVDNVPCGLHGEVLPALRLLHRRGTRIVLALRDVLDTPNDIRREWRELGADAAVEQLFDEVWVFGDQHDTTSLLRHGPLARCAARVHCCGRIGPVGPPPATPQPGRRPRVLVTGGGGRDAVDLVHCYLAAVRERQPRVASRVVLGPDFPVTLRPRRLTSELATTITDFVADLPLEMARSQAIISMAGYNTVCEILTSGKPALLVPRVSPRQEQLLRARRWAREGRVRLLPPSELRPETLWREVELLLAAAPRRPLHCPGGPAAALRAATLLGQPLEGAA